MISSKNIKLIIVDLYGVMTKGSYKDTCRWLAKKYKISFDYLYKIIYHQYFSQAAVGKITEQQSFELPIKRLGLKETWQLLRAKHISYQKLNIPVFKLFQNLQKTGYKILLLSKNTPGQFKYTVDKMKLNKAFPNIINTYDLGLPKASRRTIDYILKRFKVKPSEVIRIDDQNFNLVEPKKLGVKIILYLNLESFKSQLLKYLAS